MSISLLSTMIRAMTKTLRFLTRLKEKRRARVLHVPGPFNYARLNNLAAREAVSDCLLFLNNDVKALDGTWLDEMRARLNETDVGAVGALLAWPSGMVQHGGVVLAQALPQPMLSTTAPRTIPAMAICSVSPMNAARSRPLAF